MRVLALSIWIFINLIFFSMCGYMYLLWSQYWMYIESQTPTTANNYDQQIYYYNRGYPPSYYNETWKPQNLTEKRNQLKNDTHILIKNSRPRFPNFQAHNFNMNGSRFECNATDTYLDCKTKTATYKELVLNELRRVSFEEGSVLRTKNKNTYGVHYNGIKGTYDHENRRKLLCELKNIHIRTIKGSDFPFSSNEIGTFLPKHELFENEHFNSCAIVASAGSLKNSYVGDFIDGHDVVLRFNNAPTDGYELDVGKKTTFRIVNSQVITKSEFEFLNSKLYRNITLLAWDPSNFTSNLEDWYRNPEFNLFPNFLEHRKRYPKTKLYLLNPQSLWALWVFLQKHTPNQLRRNPPSSGF